MSLERSLAYAQAPTHQRSSRDTYVRFSLRSMSAMSRGLAHRDLALAAPALDTEISARVGAKAGSALSHPKALKSADPSNHHDACIKQLAAISKRAPSAKLYEVMIWRQAGEAFQYPQVRNGTRIFRTCNEGAVNGERDFRNTRILAALVLPRRRWLPQRCAHTAIGLADVRFEMPATSERFEPDGSA
jgi:hypothetical protein